MAASPAQPSYSDIRAWFLEQRGWTAGERVVTTKAHPTGATGVRVERRKQTTLFRRVKPFGANASDDVNDLSVFVNVRGCPFTIPLRALLSASTYTSQLSAFVLAQGRSRSTQEASEANELWMEIDRPSRYYVQLFGWILGQDPQISSATVADGIAAEAALLGLQNLVHAVKPMW